MKKNAIVFLLRYLDIALSQVVKKFHGVFMIAVYSYSIFSIV